MPSEIKVSLTVAKTRNYVAPFLKVLKFLSGVNVPCGTERVNVTGNYVGATEKLTKANINSLLIDNR